MTRVCYKFKKISSTGGFLDSSCDATYIIHLVNNGRMNNIKQQLNYFKPTKEIFILNNIGYKKCKKKLFCESTTCDLIDAFLQCFRHAKKKGFKNILILEDDFIFSEKIRNQPIINSINNFINNKQGIFSYLIGTVPHLKSPNIISDHANLILSSGTHATIYSSDMIDYVLNNTKDFVRYNDWDLYNNFKFIGYRYTYKTPLCYQVFSQTKNSFEWKNKFYGAGIVEMWFKILGINKKFEPGTSIAYILSSVIFIIMLIYILICINKILSKIKYT